LTKDFQILVSLRNSEFKHVFVVFFKNFVLDSLLDVLGVAGAEVEPRVAFNIIGESSFYSEVL